MGGNKTGAFAEFASLPERSLSLVRETLSYPQAASIGAAYSTAYTGLIELCGVQQGQWVMGDG